MSDQTSLLDLLEATRPKTSSRPKWLTDYLRRTGHFTENSNGTRRHLALTPCKCGELVLTGRDADYCWISTAVDPIPLTPLGEAMSCIEARRTFNLTRAGQGWVIDVRSADEIAFAPAGSRTRNDVVREHRCRTDPVPEPYEATTTFAEARTAPVDHTSTPPF